MRGKLQEGRCWGTDVAVREEKGTRTGEGKRAVTKKGTCLWTGDWLDDRCWVCDSESG